MTYPDASTDSLALIRQMLADTPEDSLTRRRVRRLLNELDEQATFLRAMTEGRNLCQERVRELEREVAQCQEACKAMQEGKPLGPVVGAQVIVNQQIEISRLRAALALILPMAKGYAHANRVGRNDEYIQQAEHVLGGTQT